MDTILVRHTVPAGESLVDAYTEPDLVAGELLRWNEQPAVRQRPAGERAVPHLRLHHDGGAARELMLEPVRVLSRRVTGVALRRPRADHRYRGARTAERVPRHDERGVVIHRGEGAPALAGDGQVDHELDAVVEPEGQVAVAAQDVGAELERRGQVAAPGLRAPARRARAVALVGVHVAERHAALAAVLGTGTGSTWKGRRPAQGSGCRRCHRRRTNGTPCPSSGTGRSRCRKPSAPRRTAISRNVAVYYDEARQEIQETLLYF